MTSRNRRSGDFRIGEVGFEPDRMVTIRGLAASPARKEPSSLSFHLAQLVHAGLITQRRLSRQLIYSAEYGAMNELLAYLTENCCGRGASCAPACNPADAFATGENHEAPARARGRTTKPAGLCRT